MITTNEVHCKRKCSATTDQYSVNKKASQWRLASTFLKIHGTSPTTQINTYTCHTGIQSQAATAPGPAISTGGQASRKMSQQQDRP